MPRWEQFPGSRAGRGPRLRLRCEACARGGGGVLWRPPCSPPRGLPHTALSLREPCLPASPCCFPSSWPPCRLSAFHLSWLSGRTRWDGWGFAELWRAARLGCWVRRAPCIAAQTPSRLPSDRCSPEPGGLARQPLASRLSVVASEGRALSARLQHRTRQQQG